MKTFLAISLFTIIILVGGYYIRERSFAKQTTLDHVALSGTIAPVISLATSTPTATLSVSTTTSQQKKNESEVVPLTALEKRALSQKDLLLNADDVYASGEVPLGDGKYVTSAPKKGYVYLCHVQRDNFGAQANGTWIHGDTWNFLNKTRVRGSIPWKDAKFTDVVSGSLRLLAGNGLPVGYTTGVFPVASDDPAYQIDRNPNSIVSHAVLAQLPKDPVYSDTPSCTGGGEVGIMLSGVPLFNAFDAKLDDAPAHEMQDSCDGHPQESGEYHYHSMSSCFKDISVTTVLGYALDGFPITGPLVMKNKYLTTADLDECHGVTSSVMMDGKSVMTYHYVMTHDFPYTISCFRGKPVAVSEHRSQPAVQVNKAPNEVPSNPPQEAIAACAGKSPSSSCSFVSPMGDTISGSCGIPPHSSLACIPQSR
jgi:hypothetical protein